MLCAYPMWRGGGGPQRGPNKSHFQQIVFYKIFFYLFWHGIQDSQERRRYLTPDVSLRSRSQIESPGAIPRPLLDLQVTAICPTTYLTGIYFLIPHLSVSGLSWLSCRLIVVKFTGSKKKFFAHFFCFEKISVLYASVSVRYSILTFTSFRRYGTCFYDFVIPIQDRISWYAKQSGGYQVNDNFFFISGQRVWSIMTTWACCVWSFTSERGKTYDPILIMTGTVR